MPNLTVAIAQARIWDILDRRIVEALAAKASPERTRANAHPLFAKMIVSSPDPEGRLLEIAAELVKGSATETRRQAHALADAFGADYERLIGYLKAKGVIWKGLQVHAQPDLP